MSTLRTTALAAVTSVAVAGALVLTASVSIAQPGTMSSADGVLAPVSPGAARGAMFARTSNWAGYVLEPGRSIYDVSGEWTVPAINCRQTPNALDAVWAGVGGVLSGQPLLQTGVSDSCKDGVQRHWAWWELYPANSSVTLGLLVAAGDKMQASVYRDQAGQWVTRIDNLTTGWSGWMIAGESYGVGRDGAARFTDEGSSRNIFYGAATTAEWIVEKPKVPGLVPVPLADFGTVWFADLRTGLSSWSLSSASGDEIVIGNQLMAVPGRPFGDGFPVSYTG
jgi:Peptidase A4 family